MKTLRSIFIRSGIRPSALALPVAICVSGLMASAQDYYDDDLYYDASKAKKETPKVTTTPATRTAATQTKQASPSTMYYYDGAAYVPWDSVGDFLPASSYIPTTTGSTRDVDEYNRRGPAYESAASMPDSISLKDFEEMSATEYLARFGNSQVARETLASANANDYTDVYNAGYSSGYDAGYNANPSTSLSINFGVGYPYGYYPYYNTWGWPYYSWRNPYYWYSPSWSWGWGWDYPAWSWGWSWGWTSPSWAWGWGYPGYYPGYHPGWGGYYRPSPSAAHRPRSTGYNYGAAGSRGGRYDHATPGSSSRPGYRPPSYGTSTGTTNRGYYGGSASGRNSHLGTTGNAGYRPSTGNNSSAGHNGGYTRPSGTSNATHNNGNFGASQSTRNGSYNNSNYNRSGSYNSNRSSGGFSGGSRSGGYSGGGRSGGGGHRSR